MFTVLGCGYTDYWLHVKRDWVIERLWSLIDLREPPPSPLLKSLDPSMRWAYNCRRKESWSYQI